MPTQWGIKARLEPHSSQSQFRRRDASVAGLCTKGNLNLIKNFFWKDLQAIRVTELIDESLRSFCFLHDSLFVILPDGSGEFVIVHSRAVLASSPQSCDSNGIFNFKYSFSSVQPANCGTMGLWRSQKFF